MTRATHAHSQLPPSYPLCFGEREHQQANAPSPSLARTLAMPVLESLPRCVLPPAVCPPHCSLASFSCPNCLPALRPASSTTETGQSILSGWPSKPPTAWSPVLCQPRPPLATFLFLYPQPHPLTRCPANTVAQAVPRPLSCPFLLLPPYIPKSPNSSKPPPPRCRDAILLGCGPSLPASHLTLNSL